MSDNAMRVAFLLGAAAIAGLAFLVNSVNDGPQTLTQVASAVLAIGGGLGIVLVVLGLLRRD